MPLLSARKKSRALKSKQRVKIVYVDSRHAKSLYAKSSRSKSTGKMRKKTNLKKPILGILVFIISLSLIVGFLLYKQVSKGFVSADFADSQNFDSNDIISVLYMTAPHTTDNPLILSDIKLLILDKNNNKLMSYDLPTDYESDSSGKYGKQELGKLLALGNLECSDTSPNCVNPNLLTKAVEKIFAYKVDKYILAGKDIEDKMDNLLLSSDLTSTFDFNFLKTMPVNLKTDMTFSQAYNFYRSVKAISSDNFIKNTFTNDMLSQLQYIDSDIQNITFNSLVSKERLGVSVLNASGVSGAAAFGARVVDNMGARLLTVSNASKEYPGSIIVTTNIDSDTVKDLTGLFNVKKVYQKGNEAADGIYENEIARSDVVLILGKDYSDNF